MADGEIFVHPNGLCESQRVGAGTRVWAFAHVLPGAVIGRNCNICDQVFIENDVIVGNDVTVKCGVQLWDGVRLGNGVFVGPNATFTNDIFPRSRHYPEQFLKTVVEDGASIGANATILPGRRIGTGAMVGAGAVVTRDVPPHAVVVGNPASIVGYQTDDKTHHSGPAQPVGDLGVAIGSRRELGIGGCYLERVPNFIDMRGSLTALEDGRGLPFTPQRVFLVHGVMSNHVRGEHAHRGCKQFLIAVHDSVSVILDNGRQRKEVLLDDPSVGLYLAPMVWGTQYRFSRESVLMVAASERYDSADYIRDYSTFLHLVSAT